MIHHILAKPISLHDKNLDFFWDDETGNVYGNSADYINDVFNSGECNLWPGPYGPYVTPLNNKKDISQIAAVVGELCYLPDELARFYPQTPMPREDGGIPVLY